MRPRLVGLQVLAGTMVLAIGCGTTADRSLAELPRVQRLLEPYAIDPSPAPTAVAFLAYRPPTTDCPWTYQIDVSYTPALMHEENSVSTLVLAHAPPAKSALENGVPMAPGQTFSGRSFYRGFRAEKRGVSRDWYLSREHAGPTAPTAGCMPRTWDPVEDALTLGWPRLPGRLTAVGEAWEGLRVEGKCNRSACVDPKTGAGGPEVHDKTCITMSFRTELAGVFEVGDERLALVRSVWTDGHGEPKPGNDLGIWSEKTTLVALDHGRPVWARAVVHHGFNQPTADNMLAPVERTWEMTSIDTCPGSLAALGWERSEDVTSRVEDMLERFEPQLLGGAVERDSE